MKKKQPVWLTSFAAVILMTLILSFVLASVVEKDETKETELTTAAEGPYYDPTAQPPSSVQNGGKTDNGVTHGGLAWGVLRVGYVGQNKIIKESSEVSIPRLGNDTYGLVETNVTVKRLDERGNVMQTLTGKALVFANARDTADVGYVMVSESESRKWVNVLNGNPSFVFSPDRSNIYSYTIKERNSGEEIIAYNLADLANASGGAGDPPAGDGLTRIRNDLYLKRDGFIATPRPTGGVGVAPAAGTTVRSFAASPAPANNVSMLAAASNPLPSAQKPKYIDESGKIFGEVDELLLVFGGFGDTDKAQPMVFRPADRKIFGVKKLDKENVTITVGEQIGEIIRTDQERIYFNLTIYPSLLGKELSIKNPNAPQ
ncbi:MULTISPECIES: hypothetical protein [Brevibacillus]|nr:MULTISPECIES: hypothetical protein [Brevibacillus]MED2001767.1 hypothetical protein [Brevibacillus formosus]MED2084598.1 hypothetical protein [Brevibacillus formosus]